MGPCAGAAFRTVAWKRPGARLEHGIPRHGRVTGACRRRPWTPARTEPRRRTEDSFPRDDRRPPAVRTLGTTTSARDVAFRSGSSCLSGNLGYPRRVFRRRAFVIVTYLVGCAAVEPPVPTLASQGPPPAPRVSPAERPVVVVTDDATCALAQSGDLRCWGALGDGWPASARPVTADLGRPLVRLAAGIADVCGISPDGELVCAATASFGFSTRPEFIPAERVPVPLPAPAVDLAMGMGFVCALLEDGRVACTGFLPSPAGETCEDAGDTLPCTRGFRIVDGVSGTTRLRAGASHACALAADGALRCWGGNDRRELGEHSLPRDGATVRVLGFDRVADVAAGTSFTCALASSGEVSCWGDPRDESRDDVEAEAHARIRTSVPDLRDADTLLALPTAICGAFGAELRCVAPPSPPPATLPPAPPGGRRPRIRIGASAPPLPLSGTYTDTVSLAASRGHLCVVRGDGSVACAGSNATGALGDPWVTDTTELTQVLLPGFVPVADEVRFAGPLDDLDTVTGDATVEYAFDPLSLRDLWPTVFEPDPRSIPSLLRASLAQRGDAIRECLAGESAVGRFSFGMNLHADSNRATSAIITRGTLPQETAACVSRALTSLPWPRLNVDIALHMILVP